MGVEAETTDEREREQRLTRRRFIELAAGAGVMAACGAAVYGSLVEPFACEITEQEALIADLPVAFDGFRITQLSDVHHSRLVSIDEVRRVVDLTQKTAGDMIALTGDFTTYGRRFIAPCVRELARLSAPHGVWAVLGNHDHASDPRETTQELERANIGVLSNRWTEVERAGERLALVGVDDWSWGQLRWNEAQRGFDARRPSVLLSHQPRVLDMPEASNHSLILAGHTHGGQVSLPLIGAPVRFAEEFRYVAGFYRRGATQLFVTRGTGVVALPVRIGAPPEISIIKLRRA